jgi:hypothetical protein
MLLAAATLQLLFSATTIVLLLATAAQSTAVMGWDTIKLNDGGVVRRSEYSTANGYAGHEIPSIAFGTWTLGNGQQSIDNVDQALETGFSHIGTHYGLHSASPTH